MVVLALLGIGAVIAGLLALYALQFWAEHWPVEMPAESNIESGV